MIVGLMIRQFSSAQNGLEFVVRVLLVSEKAGWFYDQLFLRIFIFKSNRLKVVDVTLTVNFNFLVVSWFPLVIANIFLPKKVCFQTLQLYLIQLLMFHTDILLIISSILQLFLHFIAHGVQLIAQPVIIIIVGIQYKSMEEKEENDLIMPLTYKNRFAKLIFTNRTIDKLAYKPTILCLAIGFLLFFIISIYMFAAMNSVKVVNMEYFTPGENVCVPGTTCTIPFNVTEAMQPPIYVMYQLQNFYQNERLFIQSKSNRQLTGVTIGQQQAKICTPYITNSQINATVSWTGVPLNPDAIASPCGMFPRAFFNDSYSITQNGLKIPIDQTGITWPGDQGGKYKRAIDSNTTQWIDPENEHFIVWMRAAGIPNFKKIWGKIHQPLQPGQYELHVNNNYNLPNWQDNKYVILTTMSSVGGQNYLLPVQMFIVSLLCLGGAIYLTWRARVFRKLE